MRLAQLARKLKVKPMDVQAFLQAQPGQTAGEGPNQKLDEEQIALIIGQYGPLEPEVPEAPAAETAEEATPTASAPEPEPVAAPEPQEPAIAEETGTETETVAAAEEESTHPEPANEEEPVAEEDGSTEVIKAPKTTLEGIKLVGKIDLPEPPPPQQIEVDGVMMDKETYAERKKRIYEERKARSRPATYNNDGSFEPRPLKKRKKRQVGLSYEEQKRKEQEAYERRLVKEAKQKKKAKKQHYLKNHAVAKPSSKKGSKKKAEAMREQEEQQSRSQQIQQEKQAPKSAWQRFVKWLNT